MSPKLQPEDEQLLAIATEMLNNRSYEDAKQLLDARIAKGLSTADPDGVLLLARIAGLLVDIGSEGHIEAAIKDGLALHDNNREHFKGLFTLASIEYNLGNAKSALAELRTPNHFITPGLADHDLLLAAKNHYWVALKAHGQDDTFAHQLRTNLGSALRKSGRITEALTAYDDVIASDPSFVMAHFHRGLSLLVLEHLSGTRTTSLLWQALNEYAIAAQAPDARPQIRAVANTMREHIAKRLSKRRQTIDNLQRQHHNSQDEARNHSAYRQFTLKHHLGLSEHSLYCRCNGARRDDLMIATSATPVAGDRVPRLELILNRIKAEFGTARLLYCQAVHDHSWDLHEHEITYAELFEGEQVSVHTELLRTSFRLCLGILDKIALGVCELYDVADPTEKLYFENFWRPKATKGKASTRWNILAAKSKNPGLVALYSQATDVQSQGEWSVFKTWRNDLEHRFLILTDDEAREDLLHAREGTFATRCVTRAEFASRTLHLLQFTRSAVFNFTYCARHETRARADTPGVTLTLQHKYPEPASGRLQRKKR